MNILRRNTWFLIAVLLVAAAASSANELPADVVLKDAKIYTAAGPRPAEALAARGGRLVYVGDAAGVAAFVGPHTTRRSAGGRLVVPGLIDAHIHPIDMIHMDACDLDAQATSLPELAAIVRACVKRYHPKPGAWFDVQQWNEDIGNQPDAANPTLRAALDHAAPHNPVQLLGEDGHHSAFNSAALALAHDDQGRKIGLSRTSLAGPFQQYRKLIGVDSNGEPNGIVNEDARFVMTRAHAHYNNDVLAVARVAQRIPQSLNRAGITAILDASFSEEALPVYEALLRAGKMTVRVSLAQFFDPEAEHRADGSIDWAGMVGRARGMREHFAGNPLVRADFVKMFADGVVEGNPFSVPPTPGNSPMLAPYLQPIFATDAAGHATVTGYVDTDSELCAQVRAQADNYVSDAAIAAFRAARGFHPAQCTVSSGMLQHPRDVELEYVRQFHRAGFNLHIHVIGDMATRTAIDAIEAARAEDGVTTTHDSLAHIQFAHPEDVARMGRDHLYLAYTYSWAMVNLDYDMTVFPFLQHVAGNSLETRHVPGGYFDENFYPVRSSRDAGAVLVAGSDAPVATRDPRPFVNMAIAVTRREPGQPAASPDQAVSIRDALDAYTINGARFLGRDAEFGSLEVGKSADFVIVDRDILALAESADPGAIAQAQVVETWFQGRRVYRAKRH